MSVFVNSQLQAFMFAVAGGVGLGLIFDVFRLWRRYIPGNWFAVAIQDVIFWTAAAGIIFWILVMTNDGEIRGYSIFGVMAGTAIYLSLLSRVFMLVASFIIDMLIRLIKVLISIVIFPIKVLIRFLSMISLQIKKTAGNLQKKKNRQEF